MPSPLTSPLTSPLPHLSPATPPIARLALEDGSVFTGCAFGYTEPNTIDAEVCFNTSLCGYQEVLTDPSYAGQIVTMTYPLIGNYGINPDDLESDRIHLAGFVVRELTSRPSNFRATQDLDQWLAQKKITAIQGIDTRALTRKLRTHGSMKAVLSTQPTNTHSNADLVDLAKQAPSLVGRNLVQTVSRSQPTTWQADLGQWSPIQGDIAPPPAPFNVVTLDCGAKHNILRNLVQSGCRVTVLPYDATDDQIMAHNPHGLFVSNGPGDPAAVTQTIQTLKHLMGKLPIFGICLGHQLLSLALGAKTYKLKFGHRGANQPVQNLHTGKVEITSQNHGFAVDIKSLQAAGAQPTHINLNDQTLEGFRHAHHPTFAVQYHPEAAPGPHDSRYLFDCFIDMMTTGATPTAQQMHDAQTRRNQLATTTPATH